MQLAMQDPLQMAQEFMHFQHYVETHPTEVLSQLCPMLIGALLLGGLFVAGCCHIGGQLAIIAYNKMSLRASTHSS